MIRMLLRPPSSRLLPLAARAQMEQQALVDRATLTVQDIMAGSNGSDPQSLLKRARAVMICPQVFRAAFIFGGSGGDCVLVARDGAGSWSYPAFYGLGNISAGLQAGIQDSEVLMLILTAKGSGRRHGQPVQVRRRRLHRDRDDRRRSRRARPRPILGADIVVAAKTRGLFAGISLQGSIMTTRTAWNRAYYGRDLAARQIVMDMEVGIRAPTRCAKC